MEKAVVLLSGGLDSTTCMAVAHSKGYELYPISFDYHQRNSIELEGARQIAEYYHAKKHLIIETNMEQIGGSALTDQKIDVPDGNIEREENDVPPTYVPARNLIFLSYALGYAEVVGADHVYIGVNTVDYSGYPDCRPEFIEKFQEIANYSTKAAVAEHKNIQIETPLQYLSKKEIIKLGLELGVPFQFTHTCYKGGKKACGICDSCQLRLRGFAEAGAVDPIEYEQRQGSVHEGCAETE